MVSEKVRIPSIFILAGFLTLIVFLIVMIAAVSLDGNWRFGQDTLSSLGGHSTNPDASSVFNYGCVLIGLLGFVFGWGLMSRENNWLYLSGLLTMLCSISLMGVGALPDSYNAPHEVMAKLFGFLSALAMIVAAIGDWFNGRRIYAAIPIVLLLVCAFMLVQKEYGLFEVVSVTCILAWMVSQSIKYLTIDGLKEYDNPLYRLTKRNGQ